MDSPKDRPQVRTKEGKLPRALSLAMMLSLTGGFASQLPRLPQPKSSRPLSQADFDRISAAKAKRERKANRNRTLK